MVTLGIIVYNFHLLTEKKKMHCVFTEQYGDFLYAGNTQVIYNVCQNVQYAMHLTWPSISTETHSAHVTDMNESNSVA